MSWKYILNKPRKFPINRLFIKFVSSIFTINQCDTKKYNKDSKKEKSRKKRKNN